MYFRELEDGYICSEGITGIPIRMLVCPHCINQFRDNPVACMLKFMHLGEELVAIADPLDPQQIIESEDETVEYASYQCPQCKTIFKFAATDIFWRNYIVTVKYEVNAIKWTYLEALVKDAGIPEEQAFLFIKTAVEDRLDRIAGGTKEN